jgi:hypothetical protein
MNFGLREKYAEMMGIENLIRYAPLAVGLKPSASQGEARLRGLERIISSKTIISAHRSSHRRSNASPEVDASRDTADPDKGQRI